MVYRKFFQSFSDAHKHIGIANSSSARYIMEDDKIKCVNLTKGDNEYDYLIGRGQLVYAVGLGNPPFNFPVHLQDPFFIAKQKRYEIPILYKDENGIILLGYYKVKEITKPIAYSGYTYFRIQFIRSSNQ